MQLEKGPPPAMRRTAQPAEWPDELEKLAAEQGPALARPYLLAPPPWPRGEFRIDPEEQP